MSLKAVSAGYREISLLRDIMFPTFRTILHEKKEEENKRQCFNRYQLKSKGCYTDEQSFSTCKPSNSFLPIIPVTFVFLTPKFYLVLSFDVIFGFFPFELYQAVVQEEKIQFDIFERYKFQNCELHSFPYEYSIKLVYSQGLSCKTEQSINSVSFLFFCIFFFFCPFKLFSTPFSPEDFSFHYTSLCSLAVKRNLPPNYQGHLKVGQSEKLSQMKEA